MRCLVIVDVTEATPSKLRKAVNLQFVYIASQDEIPGAGARPVFTLRNGYNTFSVPPPVTSPLDESDFNFNAA
jgi:hypothetical protein